MIAISSEDYNDFQCPNINCESIDFISIEELDGCSILKCQECGMKFYVSYSNYSSIWLKELEIPVVKHPKLVSLENDKPLKK